MKHLKYILALLMFTSFSLNGQNLIGITYAANDNNVGLRYERQYNQDWGFYGSGGYGHYKDISVGAIEHARISMGFTRYLINYATEDAYFLFSLGPTYHYYNPYRDGYEPLPKGCLTPYSFEIGTGIQIHGRAACQIIVDPLKRDAYVCFSVGFGR